MLQLGAPSPIGVGTPECEALSSFVQRIAATNGTFPGQLVHRILGWVQANQADALGSWQHHPRRVYLGRNINAFDLALVWRELLAKVVPGPPLIHLTANQWDYGFPTRGFLHASLHWCPLCLASGRVPYHRLLWMLQPVTHCPIHDVILFRQCPRCERMPPVLHDRAHVEICSWCAWDLRDVKVIHHRTDNRAAEELGQVIGHYGRVQKSTDWKSVAGVRELCRFAQITTPASLAKAAGTSKLTAWYWWRGKARVSLPMALHLFVRLGFSFSSAIIQGPAGPFAILPVVQTRIHLRQRKPRRTIDWDRTTNLISKILKRPIASAPTFLATAGELGIERRTLRANLPKLCRLISARHRARLQRERNDRATKLAADFNRAILVLTATGLEPRQFRIEAVLRRPGLFNRRYARAILATIAQQRAS